MQDTSMDLWLWAPRLPSALTADLSTIARGTHTITVFADDVGRIAESDKKQDAFGDDYCPMRIGNAIIIYILINHMRHNNEKIFIFAVDGNKVYAIALRDFAFA